jgi:nanoRNase/pAp phosphatase (c-di-AMP/oligoRNAs hydrolase)
MLTEYLKAAKINPTVALATALFYGIKADTQNFTKKTSPSDVLCFQYLFKRINQQLLNKIETADIRRSELKYFKIALETMITSKKRIYVHLGRVGNPDILVVVADFFAHIHDIGWVIISGQCGEKLVVIFRCDGYKKNAGKLAARVFGKIGSAGGHRQSARAEVLYKDLPEGAAKKFTTNTLLRLVVKHLA